MRYVVDLGSGNAGLSPTFSIFKRLDTLVALSAPSISAIGNGLYYFDWDWLTAPTGVTDVVFEVSASTLRQRGVMSASDQSLYSNVIAIKGKTDALPSNADSILTTVSSQLPRVLGMLHENSVLDKIVYDPSTNNLLSARFRLYANSSDAQVARNAGDNSTDSTHIAQYSIIAQYNGDNMVNYMVLKEFP